MCALKTTCWFAGGALALALPWLAATADEPPATLTATGLYVGGDVTRLARDVVGYTPQYPLWSDGAGKRRWLALPAGTRIDASDPDLWHFPPGTRLWKQFGFGRPVETRYIERLADGSWRYAVYVWQADGRDALLAPAAGIRAHPVADAPGGVYQILSRDDCRACHEGAPVPVLGIGVLQLSADRDPLAVHGETPHAGDADLDTLLRDALVVNLPAEHRSQPARIAARDATERAALGYLHANCGHCHNGELDLGSTDMVLAQRLVATPERSVLATLIGRSSDFSYPGLTRRVQPGDPARSVLIQRMRSRNPVEQMPPLGTRVVDRDGIALLEQWITNAPVTVESQQ